MKNYVSHAMAQLKKFNFKITEQRRMIVNFLAKSQKALSPYEIRDMLKKQKIRADVVTIYRVLEVLEKLSLAHKVLALNGYVICETPKKNALKASCHHYLLCKKCHKVAEVEGEDLSPLENKISKTSHFRIESHYLEFTGLCANCQKSSSEGKIKARPERSRRRR